MNFFKSFTKPLMMLSAALLLVALAAGCSGGRDPILGSALTDLVSVAVTPATASIPITGTQQFTATATFSDGSSRNVTTTSSWISGTPGVATVGPATGVATGLAGGTSLITATYSGMSGLATLTVNAATSVSFVVTPATASIPVSGTQQFAAIQTFSDGTTQNRTTTSVWSTSGASAANASVGAATGLALGITVTPAGVPVVINATFGALVATPAALTVNAATSVSFKVTPALASIPVTGNQQYTAIETFSDGTTFDRTATSTWTSANVPLGGAAVATVSSTVPTKGLATGNVIGQSDVTATLGALNASARLTVNAATSVSFKVTPALASIPVTATEQYTAIETFSDGTTSDRTAVSTWTSANVPLGGPAVATVSSTVPTKGLATGTVVGQSDVTATLGALNASARLTVNAATLVSINVTPTAASIPVSGTQQYTATAVFSDGSSLNVTTNSSTVWHSATLGVATFVAPPAVTGLTTGVAIGTSDITADYTLAGVTKTSPAGSALLTVIAGANPGPAGGVDLKSTAPFGIIAYNAITISAGHIYGDVALTQPAPGGTIASVTGAGTNNSGVAPLLASSDVTTSNGVNPGVITAADNGTPTNIAALPALLTDLGAVYADLLGRAAPVLALTTIASAADVTGGTFAAATDLSGYVLSPGIYTSPATYGLSNALGPLVLDAKGNPDAVFIIRSTQVGPSGFTSTTGSVLLQGGAQAKNVYWVMDNLTVGAGTFFQGTVVAGHAITLNAFANVEGRMLAGALGVTSGAIVLSGTNVITVPK